MEFDPSNCTDANELRQFLSVIDKRRVSHQTAKSHIKKESKKLAKPKTDKDKGPSSTDEISLEGLLD